MHETMATAMTRTTVNYDNCNDYKDKGDMQNDHDHDNDDLDDEDDEEYEGVDAADNEDDDEDNGHPRMPSHLHVEQAQQDLNSAISEFLPSSR